MQLPDHQGIGTPDQFYRHTDCNFTINKYLNHSASQVNLTDQLCAGSFDAFKVSGKWYYRGFITFRVIHEVSDGWAFFGYEASQVLNANASRMSVSDCFQIDTFSETDQPPGYPANKTDETGLVGAVHGGVLDKAIKGT